MFSFYFRTYMPVVSRIKANKDKVIEFQQCPENLQQIHTRTSDWNRGYCQFVFHVWQKTSCDSSFRWWFTIPHFSNMSTRLGSTDTGITPPPASSACCWLSTFAMRWDQRNLLRRYQAWLSNQECFYFEVGTCDMVVSVFSICSRSACLASAPTSTGIGTTTGRRTIWPEPSDTRGSTMGITNTTSPCCWLTSKRSECLKGDDTWTIGQWTFFVFSSPAEASCFCRHVGGAFVRERSTRQRQHCQSFLKSKIPTCICQKWT